MRISTLIILFFLCMFFGCSPVNPLDEDPPDISIISPENNIIIREITTILVETNDESGIERIELWINEEPSGIIDKKSPYELVWNTLVFRDTTYTIFVRSYDNSNNFADSDTISVFVNNKYRENKYPSVSPSEDHILFFSNRNGLTQIFSSDNDGNNCTNLTENSYSDDTQGWFPCIFSPHSNEFLYQSNRDGDLDLYIMNLDGLSQQQITNNLGNEGSASFSPDGKYIVFNQVTGGDEGIYIMNQDGSGQNQLTEGYKDIYPVFHPSGEIIIFIRRYWSDNKYLSAIYRINIDGSNITSIYEGNEDKAYINYPRVSPDGSVIIFDSGNIYCININGNNLKQLTFNSGRIESINPFFDNGQKIIYQSIQNGNGEIYIMNLDGSEKINLTNSVEFDNFPVVLSQSNKIIYQSSNTDNLFSYDWIDIYSINFDGSEKINLTNSAQSESQ